MVSSPYWLLFLLFNIALLAFVIVTIVRCAKDKIRLKALYIIISLLLLDISYYNINGDFGAGVGLFLGFRASSHLVDFAGNSATNILIPFGAIIYWLIRKKLIHRAFVRNSASAQREQYKGYEQLQLDLDAPDSTPPQDNEPPKHP